MDRYCTLQNTCQDRTPTGKEDDRKIKANFRLPVRACLYIAFLPASILCDVGLVALPFFFNDMARGAPIWACVRPELAQPLAYEPRRRF
jgi:hypothetical protein